MYVDVWHIMVIGFSLFPVLPCVDGDAGEVQTLVLMYRSCCLKPASVLCSHRFGTYHNSQGILTRLIRPVCVHWYCRSLRFASTRYPGGQYPCCCRHIISRRGYTRNENSNDISRNRKLYHPCVLVYKIQILRTAVVPGICYARTRLYCS